MEYVNKVLVPGTYFSWLLEYLYLWFKQYRNTLLPIKIAK
jgi:hypothetical protein